ncbi:phage regulatory CII family protein [Pantoea sp. JGM49]|uniref:phage regulatory CII family protein n=1 Tax=Pantoea sp. JGM49 TaxID=2799791 RepID=UPI001BA7851A|nr:phage regulatory CII family protein [Pantoea sp. JGM49]MBS0881093.1 phage regulatory CII family protein [Pantoea sp. JGM49]
MFDFSISTHSHFDEACREFSANHNIIQLAKKAGFNPQTIRNKLNPDQVHQLTVREMLILTDLTEDSTLVDGALAQLQCLPCVPVNEIAQENLPAYVLKATAEVGQLAADVVSQKKFTSACRRGFVQNVNAGIRCLTLAAIAVQTRVHSNPAMAGTADMLSGIGASIGVV